jgi:hypothetical protein
VVVAAATVDAPAVTAAHPGSGGADLLGRDGAEGDEDGEHEELLHAG